MTCPKNPEGVAMPTCKDICEFLCDYLEGGLPESKRASFAAHLRACPPCAAYLHQYQETIRLARKCMCPDAEVIARQVAHAGGVGSLPAGWDAGECDRIKAQLAKKPPPPDDMVLAIMQAMGLPLPASYADGKSHQPRGLGE